MDWTPAIITFFLGIVSALGIEFGKSQFERRQRRQDRRDDFQREKLIELLDPAHNVLETISRFYYPRQLDWAHTGEWSDPSEDFSEMDEKGYDYQRLTVRVWTLAYLIEDETLQKQIKSLLNSASATFSAGEIEQARGGQKATYDAYLAIAERVGELLRTQ